MKNLLKGQIIKLCTINWFWILNAIYLKDFQKIEEFNVKLKLFLISIFSKKVFFEKASKSTPEGFSGKLRILNERFENELDLIELIYEPLNWRVLFDNKGNLLIEINVKLVYEWNKLELISLNGYSIVTFWRL